VITIQNGLKIFNIKILKIAENYWRKARRGE
jgi:hypothetical protein